jgi:hypothetical protein
MNEMTEACHVPEITVMDLFTNYDGRFSNRIES